MHLITDKKTELASYFRDTNNDFLKKATDINALPPFVWTADWAFGLSK